MSESSNSGPNWPARFKNWCRDARQPRDDRSRDDARGNLWLILNSLISEYLRYHTTRWGRLPAEDLEDVSAEKSLQLLRDIESGVWEVAERRTSEITGYISKVARNGLVDRLRESGRLVSAASEGYPEDYFQGSGANPTGHVVGTPVAGTPDAPDSLIEREEFVQALRLCVSRMTSQSQLVWFLRILCGLSTREIAAHPEVSLQEGHVRVLLQRARGRMRECMQRKGYEPRDMPVGTFAEIWSVCRPERAGDRSGGLD